MKKLIAHTVSVLLLFGMFFFSYKSYTSAKKLESVNRTYYQAQSDIEELIKRRFSSLISTITLGMVKDKESKKIDLNKLKAEKIVLKEINSRWTLYLGAVSFALLLLYFIEDIGTFSIVLSIASIITLIFGIITPILMIVIHKNVNFLGDIVLSFESKTIIGTISHLYHNQNYPVAITILLFSVIVPFLKSFSMLAVLVWKRFHIAQKMVAFFKHLGKWSMVDVFVVSLLLVYLSAGSSQNSYSQIESGLYIFLIYVILSIVTSISTDRALKEDTAG